VGVGNLAAKFRTEEAYHFVPLADAMPRAFNASAMPDSVETPAARIASTIGRTFAAKPIRLMAELGTPSYRGFPSQGAAAVRIGEAKPRATGLFSGQGSLGTLANLFALRPIPVDMQNEVLNFVLNDVC
jgi:hypothetical protein